MADQSAPADLLDRAGKVFTLATNLGWAFREEGESRAIFYDPSTWTRHAPVFDELWQALLDLREAMRKPPAGFEPVAEQLTEAARIVKGIRAALPKTKGERFTAYLDFAPDLNTVGRDGLQAVKEATKVLRSDDPFPFVDESRTDGGRPELTMLDRYPQTPIGNLEFIEWVRDEVHHAAEAKRQRSYSNDTLASMVGGIKWDEARQRLALLPDKLQDARAEVALVLRRDLNVGTVERVDELLQVAVRNLRDAWEDARAGVRPDASADASHSETPAGFLGGAHLADALGVHPSRRDAFLKSLERKRRELGDASWHEVRDRRPNSPHFMYRADSLVIRKLAADYKEPKSA